MPYNPVKKYPDVIANLKRQVLVSDLFHLSNLRIAIMEELGTIREPTIRVNINAMLELKKIYKTDNPHIFSFKQQKIDQSTEGVDSLLDNLKV